MFRLPTVLAMAIAAPALVSAAPDENSLMLVQKHLEAVTSMTARFSQTDRNGHVLTGVMTLKRPGKIRFQYEKSVPQLVVADGSSLYFIDYQVRQVQRWPIGNSPLAVLLNPKRDIAKFSKLMPVRDPRVVSIEVNDPKHPEYGRITMVFERNAAAPGGLMLQSWVAIDSQNNRTTIRLTNQRFNAAVSDGAFRWTDPRGPSGPKH